MLFKVGDKVHIRKDICACEFYPMADGSLPTWVSEFMASAAGTETTIEEIFASRYYAAAPDGSKWYWTDTMFEEFAQRIQEAGT